MGLLTPVRLYQGQPGTSDGALLSPIVGNRIIKQILLANTTAVSATVTLNLVPSPGTTVAVANQIVPAITVPGNSVITLDVSLVMNVSDAIRGLQGTAAAITVSIHGVQF